MRSKIVIRNLPCEMSRSDFAACIEPLQNAVDYWYFVGGRVREICSDCESRSATAFVVVQNPRDIVDFCRALQAQIGARANLLHRKIQIEPSFLQQWAKTNVSAAFPLLNTLDASDDFYGRYVEKKKLSESLDAQEVSAVETKASQNVANSTVTPLLAFVAQKGKSIVEKKKEKKREKRKKEKKIKKQAKVEKVESFPALQSVSAVSDKKIVIAKRPTSAGPVSSCEVLASDREALSANSEDSVSVLETSKSALKPRKIKKPKAKLVSDSSVCCEDLQLVTVQDESSSEVDAKLALGPKPESKKKAKKFAKPTGIKDFKVPFVGPLPIETPV